MKLPHDRIELSKTADLAAVDFFFESVGYRGGSHSSDRILVAQEDQRIVAAVRLCSEEGFLVLRGMYVMEERRGMSVGSMLLKSASAEIGSAECWCVPYTHLTKFYSRIGFRVHEGGITPKFLLQRRSRYIAKGHLVTIMRRQAR